MDSEVREEQFIYFGKQASLLHILLLMMNKG